MSDNEIPKADAFIRETTGDDGLGVHSFPVDGTEAVCVHGGQFQILTHEPTRNVVLMIMAPSGHVPLIYRWSLSPDRARSVAAQLLQMADHLDCGKGKQ